MQSCPCMRVSAHSASPVSARRRASTARAACSKSSKGGSEVVTLPEPTFAGSKSVCVAAECASIIRIHVRGLGIAKSAGRKMKKAERNEAIVDQHDKHSRPIHLARVPYIDVRCLRRGAGC